MDPTTIDPPMDPLATDILFNQIRRMFNYVDAPSFSPRASKVSGKKKTIEEHASAA